MVTIRLLEARERTSLVPLVSEMLRHYAMATQSAAAIERALAQQPAGVEMLAAFTGDAPCGFASFAQQFPGEGIAPQIYLKDLYIAEASRGSGAGEALMRALAKIAHARGCSRIDWTTERTNARARSFYERMGARVVETKVHYRLDAARIATWAVEE